MKRKYQKPTSLDLGDVLLTAHGSCKSGGEATAKIGCKDGSAPIDYDQSCEDGQIALYDKKGNCKYGGIAEGACASGNSASK